MWGTISRDLDVKDRSLGIRELRSKYNPIPHHNKDKEGTHLALARRAQKAASYLSQEQWGEPSTEDKTRRQQHQRVYRKSTIAQYDPLGEYNTDPPTINFKSNEENKRNKGTRTRWPTSRSIKELKESSQKLILELICSWKREEHIEEEELKTRVGVVRPSRAGGPTGTDGRAFYGVVFPNILLYFY